MGPLTQLDCVRRQVWSHAEAMASERYFSHRSLNVMTQNERYAPCGRSVENIDKTYVSTEIRTPDGGTAVIETTEGLIGCRGWNRRQL